MTDDSTSLFSGWTVAWLVMVFLTANCWNYIVTQLPGSPSRIGRVILLLAFAGLLYLTLLCFVLTLRVTTYVDFSFSFSVLLPSITYWTMLPILIIGFLKTGFLLVKRRTRARSLAVLREFVPYQLCFVAIHIAYAAAYSCLIGLILCLALVGLYVFEITVTASLVHARAKRQRDKWE
jgi:hypothetical protein